MSKGIKSFRIEKGWFKKGRKPNPIWVYKKISKKMKGHKVSEKTREYRIKSSLCRRGEKHFAWRGGISTLVKRIRESLRYRQWRSDIFERDNYTCQECGVKGGKIEAHHLKSFSEIIIKNNIKILEDADICEELWNLNNGLTLCIKCHKKTKNYGNNKK